MPLLDSPTAVLPGSLLTAEWRWRHPEWSAVVPVAAAWATLVAAVFAAHPARPTEAGLTRPVLAWTVMMVAMTLPAALPAARFVALSGRWARRQRNLWLFLTGHLLVWEAFGLVTVPLGQLSDGNRARASVALLSAALWELLPPKRRALRAGHRIAAPAPDGRAADLGCIAAGVRSGRTCLLSCGPLMTAVTLHEHSALLVMLVSAGAMFAEKLTFRGTRHTTTVATILVAAAALTAVI